MRKRTLVITWSRVLAGVIAGAVIAGCGGTDSAAPITAVGTPTVISTTTPAETVPSAGETRTAAARRRAKRLAKRRAQRIRARRTGTTVTSRTGTTTSSTVGSVTPPPVPSLQPSKKAAPVHLPAGVVARVGGRRISKTAFEQRFALAKHAAGPGAAKDPARRAQLIAIAMGQLIVGSWNVQEAKDEGITVSDAELAEAVDQQRKLHSSGKGFQVYLAHQHLTLAVLTELTRISLLTQKVQARRTKALPKVTDAQVAAYFRTHKAQYKKPGGKTPPLSQVREEVRRQMESDAAQQQALEAATAFQAKWKPRTVCRPGYVITPCSNA